MKQFLLFLLLVPYITFSQTQIGQDIYGEGENDYSGRRIALSSDGTIVAIGSNGNDGNGDDSGQTRVFKNINNVWTQIGQDLFGEGEEDFFGFSLALSSNGNILAVGATENDGSGTTSGYVKVYENINNVWTQIGQKLETPEPGSLLFGISISLSSNGNYLAIGIPNMEENGDDSGQARVFKNINNVWTQIGQNINGEIDDSLGGSIRLSSDGTIVAISSAKNDNGSNFGKVTIYKNVNNIWTQIGQNINGNDGGLVFLDSLDLSDNGNILATGNWFSDANGTDSGQVKIYENINNVWTQIGQDINGEFSGDRFGRSVSLSSDGSILAIGGYNYDSSNGEDSGYVQVYKNINNLWIQVGSNIIGDNVGDLFGQSVRLSFDGSILAIGASTNDINGTDSGQVKVYDLSETLNIENNFFL